MILYCKIFFGKLVLSILRRICFFRLRILGYLDRNIVMLGFVVKWRMLFYLFFIKYENICSYYSRMLV